MALFRRNKPTSAPAAEPSALPPEPPAPPPGPKRISLGLQGGGSHGAFEWGVLDRLLEEPELMIEAITAASAGAMNAVVGAAGLAEDGPRGAKAKLDQFWRAVNQAGGRNVFGDSAIWTAAFTPRWLQANPIYRYIEGLMQSASPYEFNPFNLNPPRDVLTETADFEAVRAAPVQLFIAATDVIEGKQRIFNSAEMTPEAVLASSALPLLFQAVTIAGTPNWDGGYLANPAHRTAQDRRRDHRSPERDHLQRVARGRTAFHRLRREADRGRHADRGGPGQVPPHAGPRHRGRHAPGRPVAGVQVRHRVELPHRPEGARTQGGGTQAAQALRRCRRAVEPGYPQAVSLISPRARPRAGAGHSAPRPGPRAAAAPPRC